MDRMILRELKALGVRLERIESLMATRTNVYKAVRGGVIAAVSWVLVALMLIYAAGLIG